MNITKGKYAFEIKIKTTTKEILFQWEDTIYHLMNSIESWSLTAFFLLISTAKGVVAYTTILSILDPIGSHT